MNTTKRLLLLLAALLAATGMNAKKLTITVSEPGTLASLITERQRAQLTDLTLRGTLDGDDWLWLRSLMGVVRPGVAEGKGLHRLNLRDVRFQTGKECIKGTRITRADEVPAWAFEDCRVQEVILPTSAPKIGHDCFQRSTVRRVVLAEGASLASNAFIHCPELREVVFPRQMGEFGHAFNDCPKLQRIVTGSVAYISGGGAIHACPALREVVIGGDLGHIDGSYTFCHCPALERIVFRGFVISTGGSSEVFPECPRLRDIVFEKPVVYTHFASLDHGDTRRPYRAKSVVFGSGVPEFIAATDLSDTTQWKRYRALLDEAQRRAGQLTSDDAWVQRVMSVQLGEAGVKVHHAGLAMQGLRQEVDDGSPKVWADMLRGSYDYLSSEPDFAALKEQSRLNADFIALLRTTNSYCNDTTTAMPAFTYDLGNPVLRRVREELKLDSIAGTGDELSRIKRVMYWLHDLIRHDGSSSWPDGNAVPYNAADLIAHAKAEGRGYNCRFLAMILTDCYQALGMPARYLTCESRWKGDGDCHVITIVWSRQLQKWVWMDPSFAAYVTDENGLLLHHGEVRKRLATGRPLVLNPDANWNHESPQTKEDYLESYMAKNLYTIACSLDSRPELESSGLPRRYVVLTPSGQPYKSNIHYTTSDYGWFWQAPGR